MQSERKIRAFEGVGIPAGTQPQRLPAHLEAHTTVGRHVSYQGSGTGRPIIATHVDGRVHKGAVTVGSNGFVVGMNPVTSVRKLRPGDPGEVSDRTMQNLYHCPPNNPVRRATAQTSEARRIVEDTVRRVRTE